MHKDMLLCPCTMLEYLHLHTLVSLWLHPPLYHPRDELASHSYISIVKCRRHLSIHDCVGMYARMHAGACAFARMIMRCMGKTNRVCEHTYIPKVYTYETVVVAVVVFMSWEIERGCNPARVEPPFRPPTQREAARQGPIQTNLPRPVRGLQHPCAGRPGTTPPDNLLSPTAACPSESRL